MGLNEVDLNGGDSVYCINQVQLKKAKELAENDPESAPRLSRIMEDLKENLNRNEQAALAFLLIDGLTDTKVIEALPGNLGLGR